MFVAHYENTMRNARPKFVEPAVVRTIEQIRTEKRSEAERLHREESMAWAAKVKQQREDAAREARAALVIASYRVIDIRDCRTPVRQLIEQVGAFHGVSYSDIVGVSRTRLVVKARFDAIRAVRQSRPDLSTPRIGKHFNRDHTSILHALGRLSKASSGAESDV